MRYARVGASDLVVSRIGLGMMSFGDPGWRSWMLDESAAEPIVRRAAESGVTLFDTGNHYSAGLSEEITGRLLRRIFTKRDEYILATKVGAVLGPAPHQRGLSRRHILTAVNDSLRRLGTDHIDLYQVHRFDPATPVAETVAALHDLIHAGKVHYLGAGSMYAWQLAGGPGFISMQNHYNLAYREEEREMIPHCRGAGIGVLPWSPLARGLLTGSRTRDGQPHTPRASGDPHTAELYTDEDFDTVDTLTTLADELGLSPATVALAWLVAKPAVTAPILGATHPGHVDHAVAALDIALSDEQVRRLEGPYRPHPVRGHY